MQELISIIVPVYNAEQFLPQCIESIINQTYKDIEIILINDGSTDSSLTICEKYKKIDQRLQIISQENKGSAKARKTGLEIAQGKYIGFVDADDYIEPDMYEVLYKKIIEKNVDFVQSEAIVNGNRIPKKDNELIDFNNAEREQFIKMRFFEKQDISFTIWSKLFKAEIIKNAYMQIPNEQNYGEDMLCMLNVLLECERIYLYNEAFYQYRIYDGSLSHVKWLNIILEESKLHAQVKNILVEKKCLDKYSEFAEKHYKKRILYALAQEDEGNISITRYKFVPVEMLANKNIVIYGAGSVGKDYYNQLTKYNKCRVVAWVDKDISGSTEMTEIIKPEQLLNVKFDMLIIAIKNKIIAEKIKMELQRYIKEGIEIVWEEPVHII